MWLLGWQCWLVSSDNDISKTTGLITIIICTDNHGHHRMNSTDFGDPLTFPLAPA